MSIGYEIGVTALQMATAFATIANDGVKIQPHIIKEIRQSDETVLSVAQPEKEQVVSPQTARDLRTMLREVVLSGTGRRAQLDGYTSAGKTGTAWKFNPATRRVDPSKYVSSFIGMAPAEDPDVVIAVVMDEPQVGARDGGMVSAPVFKEIAEGVLPELNVNPDKSITPQELVAQEIPETASNGEGPGKELDITTGENAKNAAAAKNAIESTPKAATKKPEVKKPAEVEKNKKEAPAPKKVTGNKGKQASVKPPLRETRIKSSIEGTRLKT
jgi:membrane peptidoglycan carboxypeptidase